MAKKDMKRNILKDHKKFVIYSSIFMLVAILLVTKTLGKYVLKQSDSQSVVATKFYFESNALSIDGKDNDFYNWNGKDSYELNFDIFNFEDELRYNSQEISYSINIETDSNINVQCFINDVETNNGTLANGKQTTDKIKLIITPNSTIANTETFNVYVASNLPYTKTLSGTFNIMVNEKNYDVNLINESDYEKLIITTYEYTNNLKIKYSTEKLMLYSDNMKTLDDGIILTVEKNSNYQIEFIKLTSDQIELGSDDIRVEELN